MMTGIGMTMNNQLEYVFVYGTLKRGESANYKMPDGTEDGSFEGYVGDFISESKFRVFGEGFPMAILSTTGHPLLGEVYLVTRKTIEEALDPYEGYPNFYTRDKLVFSSVDPDGSMGRRSVAAWIYHIPKPEGYYNHPLLPNDEGVLNWTRG